MNMKKALNLGIIGIIGIAMSIIMPLSSYAAPPVAVDDTYTIDEDTTPMVGTAKNWHVAPDGFPRDPAGEPGSIENPWYIESALMNTTDVGPGDTIWLRGGIYRHHNRAAMTRGYKIDLRGGKEHRLQSTLIQVSEP